LKWQELFVNPATPMVAAGLTVAHVDSLNLSIDEYFRKTKLKISFSLEIGYLFS